MGIGNVVVNVVWKLAVVTVYAALYELTPLRLDADDWWVWVLLFFADDLAYYWFHRVSHESRVFWASHVVHHSVAALQPLDRAAPDLGADDLPAVLAAAAAARLRALDGPAGPELEPDLPVLAPHRARSGGCRGRSRRCSTRRRTTASTTAPTSSTSTATTAGSSSSGTGCSARFEPEGERVQLRADDEHPDVQPRQGRVPRVRRAVARPAVRALVAGPLEPAAPRARLQAAAYLSRRESRRSLRTRPSVWSCGQ